jgi:hypothetical protein
MMNTADMTGGKPIALLSQSISGASAINPYLIIIIYRISSAKTS